MIRDIARLGSQLGPNLVPRDQRSARLTPNRRGRRGVEGVSRWGHSRQPAVYREHLARDVARAI